MEEEEIEHDEDCGCFECQLDDLNHSDDCLDGLME